jgi:tetratricopeptide (TPR) repeat protein
VSRRVPVQETRRFLNAPIVVSNEPLPTPARAPQPVDIERHYSAGTDAFHAARYDEAAREFAWVVENDPDGPNAGSAQWHVLRSRLRNGDANAAMDALDGLLRHYGPYLREQSADLHAGLEHLQRNELAAALAALEKMVGDDPDSEFTPLAYALIARIHWAQDQPFEMVRAFARMFGSVKDNVPAYRTLASVLDRYASGDPKVTNSFRELAQTGDEGFRDIYQYLEARTLLERDQFEPTRQSLEELRRRHPDGDFTHIVDLEHAWNLLRHGQAAEALAIFKRLQQEPAPERANAFDAFFDLRAELPMGIARCHLALKQYDHAIAAFNKALEAGPTSFYDVPNRLDLALAFEGLGQYDRAAEVLRGVIRDHPDHPKLWALRQQLARVEGQYKSANGE